jgi:fructokinase
MFHRIGIDLGGTKTEGIVLAPDGTITARQRIATPRNYDATIDAIANLVASLERQANVTATVGIGIPGVINPATGLVKNANSTWLVGRPLAADLERALGRPVRAMNDANCFAISEAIDGAARDASTVFGVILGTGVGGGVVINGRVLIGANLIAGEWGHNPLPWMTPGEYPGAPCYCGKLGCIETWLSGPAFERGYAERAGASLAASEIVRAAQSESDLAKAVLREYEDRLTRALASLINVLDPEVIVLGGGMSNVPSLADAVTAALPKYVFSDSVRTRVVPNMHGDSSGVRGAAWLWADDTQQPVLPIASSR